MNVHSDAREYPSLEPLNFGNMESDISLTSLKEARLGYSFHLLCTA